MQYIHERKDWPNLRWDGAGLLSLLTGVRHRQGALLGRMKGLGFQLREEANFVALQADVLESSAIEGETLNAAQVRSSIARRLGLDFGEKIRVGRQVDGVVEMMLDATRSYAAPLTRERLFAWHASLFSTGRSGIQKIAVGTWRTAEADPMRVVSGTIGHERVHYEAPIAVRIPCEMTAMLDWFNAEQGLDPVLKAGLAHFRFVTIHPFEDGNGRIARAIADMMLARSENTGHRFYSMSSQIEAEKKDYYRKLEESQKGDTDVTSWLEWFIACLGRAIDGAELLLAATLRKAAVWSNVNNRGPINARQQQVINRLLNGFEGKLTSSKYAKLAGCSPDTALRDIRTLIERGILVQAAAGGRSTSYGLAEL